MELSDFDFELPAELIAQEPLAERAASRMLVVERARTAISDANFSDLPRRLRPSDLLVVNNTRVFPARLRGVSETGAAVEIFLVEEIEPRVWLVLAKPGRRLRPGKRIDLDGRLTAEVLEKRADGTVVVQFEGASEFDTVVDDIGRTPLPPYIHRDNTVRDADRERYQTVYASRRGAIAAPTAGLHFSATTFDAIGERGTEIAEITLHVGYGTFEPVRAEVLSRHKVAPERFEIGETAAAQLEQARCEKRRIVAVGTTTTRTLEYVIERFGKFSPATGKADLTVLPGHQFKVVGALVTNFHLPKSSLLVLVATFGGHQLIMDAYRHAVASRYRFYSYGDCMFIE